MDPRIDEILALVKENNALLRIQVAGDKPTFDPEIRIDPAPYKERAGWTGPSQVGKKFSEAPAQWLEFAEDMYRGFAAKAKKNDEKTSNGGSKEEWNLKLADHCKRWAKYNLVMGGGAPAAKSTPAVDESGDLPF